VAFFRLGCVRGSAFSHFCRQGSIPKATHDFPESDLSVF
jgi:hypothetical protein